MSEIKYDNHNPPRRPRDVAVPTGKRVVIRPRDLVWFEMLHRHGALSFPYLYALAQALGLKCHYKWAQERAKELFHEGYLKRPHQQFGTIDARYQTIVYDLSEKAIEELHLAGLWRDRAPLTSFNHWVHDYALSCITASIHIEALRNGHGFIFQDEILARADTGLSFNVDYQDHGRDILLKPDRLCGIKYPNGKARFFVLEFDRGTERQRTTKPNVKSIERTAKQYKLFIGGKRYKELLDIPGGLVAMNVTISQGRQEEMMRVWQEVYGGKCTHAIFAYLPQFSRYFKPPAVLSHLFTDPWQRVAMEPFVLSEL